MENRPEPARKPELQRKPADKRSPPVNAPLAWALAAVGIVVLLLVLYVERDQAYLVSYSDLLQLVKTGSVDVTDPSDSKRVARYSALDNVRISPQEITGMAKRQEVGETKPSQSELATTIKKSPDDRVNFRVDNSPTNDNKDLKDAIESANQNAKSPINFAYVQADGSWKTYWLPTIALTVCIVVVLIIGFRRMGGAGSPMAFGRSRGKMYAQEDLGIMFDDVAGIDEAVEELREVVDFLRMPERYQSLGGRIPKGVLLVGPPGTGKTLLAKAIAGEAGVPFFSLSGSDFVEMFVGVGAARVRDMFQQAESKSPCIIFIDELDALGKTRGTSVVGGHDEREQTPQRA